MIVIADSSPINILVRIGHVGVLPKLFRQVVIPEEVRVELSAPQTPAVVREFMDRPPDWLVVQSAPGVPRFPGIDAGEAAAIQLAIHHKVQVILMDDWDGRQVAVSHGFRVIGTIGVLEQSAVAGLLELPAAVDLLRATDFRAKARLLTDALARDAARRGEA